MSHALEGTPKPVVTLTEQANGQRLCRSMFIGHSAGYLLIFAAAIAALGFFGFTRPVSYDAVFAVTDPAIVLHFRPPPLRDARPCLAGHSDLDRPHRPPPA